MTKRLTENNSVVFNKLLLWLLTTILVLLLVGYRFIYSDQTQYFIYPYRLSNANFIVRDWFTWETTPYHIFFSYIVYALKSVGDFKLNVFAVYVIFTLLLVVSLWLLIREVVKKNFDKLFIPIVLILITCPRIGLGDSTIKTQLLLAQDMAFPLEIFSIVLLLKRKWLMSSIALGIAGLLHINFIMLGLLVYSAFFFLGYSREPFIIKKNWVFFTIPLLIAIPTIYWFFNNFIIYSKINVADTYNIFFRIRSPHHYLPSTWPPSILYAFLIYNFMGFFSLIKLKDDIQINDYISVKKITFSLSILLIAGAFFSVIYPVNQIIQLYVWRFSPLLTIFSTIFVVMYVNKLFYSRIRLNQLFGVLILLTIIKILNLNLFIFIPILLFLSKDFFYQKIKIPKINFLESYSIFILVILIGSVYFLPINLRKEISIDVKTDRKVRELYKWVESTPTQSTFLIPPYDSKLNGFRILANRAIFVNFKAFPVRSDEISEWKRRMDLVGLKPNDYYELKSESILNIMTKKGIDYFITNKKLSKNKISSYINEGFSVCYKRQNNPYVVFKIRNRSTTRKQYGR